MRVEGMVTHHWKAIAKISGMSDEGLEASGRRNGEKIN